MFENHALRIPVEREGVFFKKNMPFVIRLVGDRRQLIHSVHLPMNWHWKRRDHGGKPIRFVQSKYSK